MRPDDLADADVAAVLEAGWGLDVERLEHAPVGFGGHHWYADTDAGRRFVTVDDIRQRADDAGVADDEARRRLDAALTSASELAARGLDFVVAGQPDRDGSVTRTIDDRYVVAVYPYVEETSPDERSVRWHDSVTDRLVALHGAEPPAMLITDDHRVPARQQLAAALVEPDPPTTGPYAKRAAHLLRLHSDAVSGALDEYDRLVEVVSADRGRYVVTHGEPHRGNTIESDRGLHLIDWDTALLAPPERDLWVLVEDDPGVAHGYEDATGNALDDDALAAYRLWWDLAEIALFTSVFRGVHGEDDDTATAWASLQRHLDPSRWDFLP